MKAIRFVRGRQLRAVLIIAALAVGVLWIGRLLQAKGLTWAANVSSVVSMFLGGIALLTPLFTRIAAWLYGPRPVARDRLGAAKEELAAAVGWEWAEEERLRRIYDPRPLPVRWEVTSSASAATAAGADPISDLAGQFTEIHALLKRLSPARLVILGMAGAGKSVLAIKLAHDILAARTPDMPVPVILQAATWDVDTDLPEWIAEQLAHKLATLAQPVRDPAGTVSSLGHAFARGKMVFPIIDGFDELPETVRGRAIEKINRFGSDNGLVLTSRPDEYQSAVTTLGRGVARAAVVEVLPLRTAEAKQYLSEATAANPLGRWAGVFGLLDAEPDGPLARVLRTPLMLWLARTVYESSARDPAELLNQDRFANQGEIEEHLLDAFIPAAYSESVKGRKRRYRPQHADRWLGFLARYQTRNARSGIAWWQLADATFLWNRLCAGLRSVARWNVLWAITAILLARHGNWRTGGFSAREPWSSWIGGPLGRQAEPEIRVLISYYQSPDGTPIRAISRTLLPWLEHAKTLLPWISISHFEIMVIGIGIFAFIFDSSFTAGPVKPSIELGEVVSNAVPIAAKAIALSIGLVMLVIPILLRSPLIHGITRSLRDRDAWFAVLALATFRLPALAGNLTAPIDLAGSLNARRTLSIDRRASWTQWTIRSALEGTTAWLLFGSQIAIAYGILLAARRAINTLPGSPDHASHLYRQARIPLFVTGRAPWRLVTFLEDAHRRGALRQDGATYQFRHIRLQERLAETHPTLTDRVDERLQQEAIRIVQTFWPKLLVSDEEFARQHGWQATLDQRSMVAVYRDPRFDQFVGKYEWHLPADLPAEPPSPSQRDDLDPGA